MEEENDKLTEREKMAECLDAVLAAIANLKSDFSSKLDGILSAIETVRKDVNECAKWVGEAEARISATEDSITTLEAKVRTLENNNKDLEDKVLDLEARSRRSNLRLVNLPEGAEGEDACVFLENWLPEVLNLAPPRTALTLERAHRVGQKSMSNTAAPRTMIMKFLNYKDKMTIAQCPECQARKSTLKEKKAYIPIEVNDELVERTVASETLTTGLQDLPKVHKVVLENVEKVRKRKALQGQEDRYTSLVGQYTTGSKRGFVVDSYQVAAMWQGSQKGLRKLCPLEYDVLIGALCVNHHWTLIECNLVLPGNPDLLTQIMKQSELKGDIFSLVCLCEV
ncbi:LINE-1 type transposase domain-containing 1 [Labeo rohita]|uniref:LINE-1 type transposase domain-containing 1 n=1 Tax=Labeo rohita TaxID=84645 RepID=A0A498MEE9_LABRO|nr:LINE-1 type transposase domain-containing 1 [Labeo rohita]